MAERIWVVHRKTWRMQLMWQVDAREAVRLGDYAYAPVGGYDPPPAPVGPDARPAKEAA